MNFTEILKSIQHFHENIIAKAHYSPDWNEETITNAFLWADFCEQIYEKFSEDDQTVKNLDKQMHYLTANYTGMSYCFKNLKGSCSLLCQSFLQNPNIEQTFLRDIIQRIQPSGLNFEDVILEVSVVDNLCLELLDSLKNISISNSDRLLYSEIKAELLLDFLKDVIAQLSTEEQTLMNEVSFDYDEIINHFQILLSIQDELCKTIQTHLTALLEHESKISIWHDIWSHIKP
ncbi:uncharacterized protein CEXT_187891 [Caerostris extrusa]|uniref:Uncharacterized protein n=1 Tax=Caerostris extrusa TaxID=172846 RepID=A0AAV4MNB9_CAEEX|nr:uncharacterized protein CEXT_187891 [Caerostris extrusa]